MSVHSFSTDELKHKIGEITACDEVFLSGVMYTARDAAHKRLKTLIENGEELPFKLKEAVIYYTGPTPERPGMPIGSCGPTTSSRMDVFTPLLLENGLLGMIGKGPRNQAVINSIKKHRGIYFCAVGGAGALAAMCVKSLEVIAFEELGCESVKKLTIERFPLICGIDCYGYNAFK